MIESDDPLDRNLSALRRAVSLRGGGWPGDDRSGSAAGLPSRADADVQRPRVEERGWFHRLFGLGDR